MKKIYYKLYFVKTKGSGHQEPVFGEYYVLAEDTKQAYDKVRQYLNKKDSGFEKDRELLSIELLADSYEYTNVRHRLFC